MSSYHVYNIIFDVEGLRPRRRYRRRGTINWLPIPAEESARAFLEKVALAYYERRPEMYIVVDNGALILVRKRGGRWVTCYGQPALAEYKDEVWEAQVGHGKGRHPLVEYAIKAAYEDNKKYQCTVGPLAKEAP